MSCPKTQHLLQEYFSDGLTPLAKKEIENHLNSCEQCNDEFEFFLLAHRNMKGWKDQSVPHWDRGLELFKREHRSEKESMGFWGRWQLVPTAISFVMLCVLLLNVSVISGEQGFFVSFGANSSNLQLQYQLAEIQEQYLVEMDTLVNQVGEWLDSNNVQVLQVVMERTREATMENLDLIYAYFEQQRLRDLEDMRISYQELVDSDYETIRSLQQLARFVSYQDDAVQ